MASENNNENDDLNGAVEQVITEDGASSSDSLTGNQNNQQSTAANTVATGTDAVAPLVAEEESQDNSNEDLNDSPTAEEGEENNVEAVNEEEGNNADNDTGSNVVDSELDESGTEEPNSTSAQSNTETQDVGGEEPQEGSPTSSVNNGNAEEPEVSSFSVSGGAQGANSEGGAFSDEAMDSHTFGVNVESERSIYSDELEHSDTTIDTMTFAVNVSPVNDAPTVVDQLFTMQEDGVITFTAEELLAGSADIDNDTLHIDAVTYTGMNGVLSENPDGSFSFAPNENFNGHVNLGFTVSDSEATVEASIELTIEGVNDIPVAGATSYQVDEDHVLTFTTEQLLANSSDVEGEVFVQSVTYPGFEGELVNNQDGTYSFTPNPNYYGELDFNVVIVDNEGATASTTANIQIVSINDPVIAVDDSELSASEPLIRLDSAPEHGTLEYLNDEYEWVEMVVGEEYPADTEVQFVPNVEDVQSATCDIQVGSFDNNTETPIFDGTASTSDWGVVDGNTAIFTKDGVTITTEVTSGELFAWNGAGNSMGAGIGDQSNNGLSNDDTLTVTIDGEDVNQITFQLDGLGSWFDESDPQATEVVITAYNSEGNVIDSQGGFRESGEYQDLYAFTTDQPVHHFELGTSGGGGTYVVQNMTVSRTLSEDLQLITIQPDGSETNSELTLDLNYNTADQAIDVTEELINIDDTITSTPIQVLEDGQLLLSVSDLLANDSDADGDLLTIIDVHTTDNSHGEVSLTEDGQVLYIPDQNYSGEADFHYVVTDGNGSFDSATVTIDVIPQQDAPIVSSNLELVIDEDGSITLTQDDLLAHTIDLDGDDLTASNLLVGGNAQIIENEDGSFTITPDENFNGELAISFDVTDGIDVVETGIDLTVNAVNDLTVVSGDVSASTDEDHSITITQAQLLANAADIDGDDLSALNLVAENADIVAHENGSFTITPHQDFNGMINVSYGIHDGTDTVASNLLLTVDPVNDAPVISADVRITIEEDGSYTVTQEELLQFATDVDNDDLTANIGEQGTETTATGTVVDAESGEPISGVRVELSDEFGNSTSTVTEMDGSYSVTGLVSGEGTVFITEEGCITSCFPVNEGETLNSGTIAISEVMDVTDMRIVVTWGDSSETRDLDNHLWLYNTETGDELDHIYYQDMSHQLGDGTVLQDVDDTSHYGPETISIPNYADANMHYSVHNYTARSWDVEGVDDVKVDVFVGDTLVTSFVPNLPEHPTGDHWHVFDIVGGVIVPAQFVASESQFAVPSQAEVSGHLDAIDISDVVNGSGDENHESENNNTEGSGSSEGEGENSGSGESSISDISIPNGVITDNGDGTYTITPDENFNGEFSINYSVDDGNGAVVPAQVDVSVTAVNDLAIVQDHSFTLNEDGDLIITDEELLTGSFDVDGDELSVESVTYAGDDGSLISNNDGTHTFTPNEHFSGSLNLDFSVNDGTDNVDANIAITVDAVADAPNLVISDSEGQAINDGDEIRDSANVIELNLAAELVDQDLSESLVVTMGGAPEGSVIHYDGDAVINDQTYGLTSYADTNVTVTFQGEGAGYQNSAGYYIVEADGSISDVKLVYENASEQGSGGDLIPGTSSFSFDIEEGQSFNLFVVPNGFNHNNFGEMHNGEFAFRDEDGSPSTMDSIDPQLIFIDESGIETLIQSQNGDTIYHGGNSTNLNQDGVEHTRTTMNEQGELVYGIEDLYGGGDRDYDDFTFTIDLGEVNQSIYSGEIPVIGDDPIIIPTIILDQVIALELPEGYSDEFDLVIEATSTEESNQDTSTTTQTIHVDAIEYAPEVTPITAVIDEDNSITLTQADLLANATDINGDDLVATNLIVTNGQAEVTLNEDGSYTITPDADFNGAVGVSFDVSDGLHTVGTELQLSVTAINDAPVAPTLVISESEDEILLIDPNFILSQVSDVDSAELTLESISIRSPAQASITQNQEGMYQVIVPEHFNGPIDIAYAVSDGELTTEGTVNLTIIPVDDAPFQTGNAHLATNEDGAVTFNSADLIDLFGDVDSALTVSRVITAEGEEAEGTVIDNEDGTWTFTPTDDFAGTTGLQVVVTDGTTEASMDMNVYIRPVADGVAITTSFDGPLVFPEDSTGHFGINIEQLDTSEIMTSVMMTGYPIGFVVGDGEHSVTITEQGQSIDIGDWNLDDMTMTPPADFNGDFFVTVSVVSLDEVEDPANNPVTQELGSQPQDESSFVFDDDGYALLLSSDLLNSLEGTNTENSISGVSYSGDNGTLIDNDNGTWSFWTNPDYDGGINVDFTTSDGGNHQVTLIQNNVDEASTSSSLSEDIESQSVENQSENEADYTAAPGDTLNIDIPSDISNNDEVEHILVNGLPDGVEPVQGLSDGEGGYVVSDISQPITLAIDENFSGEVRVEMVGMTAMDDPIDGAVGFSLIDVDSSYEMQGTSADNNNAGVQGGDDLQNQDWTAADNTDIGVDVMDDSASFNSPTQDANTDDDLSILNDQ